MKAIILLGILLLSGFIVPAQTVDSGKSKYQLVHQDSVAAAVKKSLDSISKAIYEKESVLQQEQAERNINNIVEIQQENRSRQKKSAIIRIAIGVGFLGLLIVGLLRRRKTQSKTK